MSSRTVVGYFMVILMLMSVHADHNQDSVPCTEVHQGRLCGEYIMSRSGRTVAAYKGIPFAKPPIGPLRFKDPVPANKWSGTWNATTELPMCIQKNYFDPKPIVTGEEDCLYLSVYTPHCYIPDEGLDLVRNIGISIKCECEVKSKNCSLKEKLPVMYLIFEGGWFFGSGASFFHGPEYFMDEDVVLVAINYRLSIFGFLSTLDDAATGNWALKDQTLGLQWVQDNIASFGGDPNSVTIFGQSAGAGSVQYLMLSPRTKGLFHKAISQSGSALDVWANPLNSLQIAKAQADFVGCPTNKSNEELVQCLREKDAKTLLDGIDNFKFWSIEPLCIYIPSVEKKTEANPNPFIPDVPLNLLKNLDNFVPHITGIVGNEGLLRAAAFITQEKLRNDLNSRWTELFPKILVLEKSLPNNVEDIPKLMENITQFYMKGQHFINIEDQNSMQGVIDMYGDRFFIYGVYQAGKYFARWSQEPVYFYQNDFVGRDDWSSVWAGQNLSNVDINFKFNKSHCDDLNLLFRIPAVFSEPFPENSVDTKMSKKLVAMWTNFAKYGKPTENWIPLPRNGSRFPYLHIINPENITMKDDFLQKRMSFWENLDIFENR